MKNLQEPIIVVFISAEVPVLRLHQSLGFASLLEGVLSLGLRVS